MSTEFIHELTVFAPEHAWHGANHLACCIGRGGLAELQSFVSPRYVDGNGVLWAWVSAGIKQGTYDFIKHNGEPPPRPEWDADEQVDMEAAAACWDEMTLLPEGFDPEQAVSPSGIVVGLNANHQSIAAALGLTPVEDDA